MALERRSASQVVTFSPQQALWSYPILAAGAYSTASWAVPYQGLPYIVVGTYTAGSPIAPGDRFQLFTGTSLKEPTVFTVAGLTPSAGFSAWNVFFSPAPQQIPTTSDTATSLAAPKNPRWLGALGHVSGLSYSFSCPGGPKDMSCLLQVPPNFRTDAMDPGRVVQIWRGASIVWEGKLNEPSPGPSGWTITAHGAGTYGTDFMATYLTWNADEPVNRAIARGLRWANPGIGTPAGIYLSQQQDSGAESITGFLDLLCTGGGLLWQVLPPVASGVPAGPWPLWVFPLPTDANGNVTGTPDLMLVASTPVARTVTADINTIVLRYQATADVPATSTVAAVPATYATTFIGNAPSTSKHGPMEYYVDVSSAGVMTATAAQAIGQNILTKFVRASFAGPFTAGPGQLLNTGGAPVDLGIGQAGNLVKVLVTDAPYGGEVAPAPLVFLVGEYDFDDDSDTATITPYQGVRTSVQGVIGALYPQKF